MKAILTYSTMIDNKQVKLTRLFDTEKAKKICDVKNAFNSKVQEIYITEKSTVFLHNINKGTLEIGDQEKTKEWIGENEPDIYIKFFGEVEEG